MVDKYIRSEYHGVVKGSTQLDYCTMQVFRNPRKHKTRLSRWILYRTSNGSSEGFLTAREAMAYGSRLNPKVRWVRHKVDPT